MFVFESTLATICGLLAMTAMACGGDDSTATGSSDITSASGDSSASSSTANELPATLPGCSRGGGASAVDPSAGGDPTTDDATSNSSTDSDAVPCTAPTAGASGNGTAAGTNDGTGGIGSGSTG